MLNVLPGLITGCALAYITATWSHPCDFVLNVRLAGEPGLRQLVACPGCPRSVNFCFGWRVQPVDATLYLSTKR